MKVSVISILAGIILFPFLGIGQTIPDSVFVKKINVPNAILDISYSNNYLFLNNTEAVRYSNGDIVLKLNNDFELNAMGLLDSDRKNKRNQLYGGGGINFSEYTVNRHVYYDQQGYSGHFPMTYSYAPDKLKYNLQALRVQLQLGHYTFYKRVILFQKLGVAYTSFIKSNNSAAHYTEQYGNSVPNRDPAYITASNPEGWYFKDNYTYTDKNDMDIYKNSISAFYKFGVGIRIRQFTPFTAFEFSYVSKSFGSQYLKFQVGVKYSILSH